MKIIIFAFYILIIIDKFQGVYVDDQLCMSYDNQQNCQVCVKSYNHEGRCVKPKNKIKNCLKYSNEKSCIECKFSYYLYLNECRKIKIKNCLIQNQKNFCKVCKQNLINNISNGQCDVYDTHPLNCRLQTKVQQKKSYCTFCKEGFSNEKGFCYKEKTQNCMIQDGSNCKVCNYGYYMKDKECLLSQKQEEVTMFMTHIIYKINMILLFLL